MLRCITICRRPPLVWLQWCITICRRPPLVWLQWCITICSRPPLVWLQWCITICRRPPLVWLQWCMTICPRPPLVWLQWCITICPRPPLVWLQWCITICRRPPLVWLQWWLRVNWTNIVIVPSNMLVSMLLFCLVFWVWKELMAVISTNITHYTCPETRTRVPFCIYSVCETMPSLWYCVVVQFISLFQWQRQENMVVTADTTWGQTDHPYPAPLPRCRGDGGYLCIQFRPNATCRYELIDTKQRYLIDTKQRYLIDTKQRYASSPDDDANLSLTPYACSKPTFSFPFVRNVIRRIAKW